MNEVLVALVIADDKVTVPRRVRDVLQLKIGDYVRVTITEVITQNRNEPEVDGALSCSDTSQTIPLNDC